MCNFHQAVALRAATDPETGIFNAGHRAVIRVALSRYWAERYVEGGDKVNGYNPYPLATREQQDAFERSGLKRPLQDVEADEISGIAILRAKLAEIEKTQNLSVKGLKLPPVTAREPFLDMAIDTMYVGDPRGIFRLIDTAPRPDLVPLHRAVQDLHHDPEARMVLENLVKGKICTLYIQAPQQVNQKLVEFYERLPQNMRDAGAAISRFGGNIILGGFSGLLGHSVHYASVLGAGIAAGAASTATNIGLSAIFLGASYSGWHQLFGGKYQNAKQQGIAFGVQAGLALGVMMAAQGILGHEHSGDEHMHSAKAVWFESLPEEIRSNYIQTQTAQYNRLPDDLQDRLNAEAAKFGISPAIYMLTCDGTDPLSIEANAYLAELNRVDAQIVVRASLAPGI